jgi:hypothetical protein
VSPFSVRLPPREVFRPLHQPYFYGLDDLLNFVHANGGKHGQNGNPEYDIHKNFLRIPENFPEDLRNPLTGVVSVLRVVVRTAFALRVVKLR